MPLEPGYNLVTEAIEDPDAEYGVLEFFRAANADAALPEKLTVTGLADLLYYVADEERSITIGELRSVLRETSSVDQFTAVQFLIDGRLSPADRFQVRVERHGEAVILDLGELFVAEPDMRSANHAVAPK